MFTHATSFKSTRWQTRSLVRQRTWPSRFITWGLEDVWFCPSCDCLQLSETEPASWASVWWISIHIIFCNCPLNVYMIVWLFEILLWRTNFLEALLESPVVHVIHISIDHRYINEACHANTRCRSRAVNYKLEHVLRRPPEAPVYAMKLFELTLPPWYSNAVVRHITFGILIGFTLSVTSTSISSYWRSRRRQSLSQEQNDLRPIELRSNEVVDGITGLIGT
jgi:hypothetical protein